MPKLSEFAPLGIALLLGASGGLVVHQFGDAPGALDDGPPTYLTVESETPEVRFAIIANGHVGAKDDFVTPATIRIADPEISLMVVPLHGDESITVQTSRPGSFKARSSGSGYVFHHLTRSGVTARSFERGALDRALGESGLSFTGVEFGGGVVCVRPEVWDLMLSERLAEARAACVDGAAQR